MFTGNWFIFILIVMIVFSSDGEMSQAEMLVLIGIVGALALTCCMCPNEETMENDCFCNHNI